MDKSSTAESVEDASLVALLREARRYRIGPPSNPKKIARLKTKYGLHALVDMGTERRSQAADACKRLHVGGVDAWFAECLCPGEGAAAALADKQGRKAENERRHMPAITRVAGASRTAPKTGVSQATQRSKTRTAARARAEPSLAWCLPADEPTSSGSGRVATGDGPRTRPRLGIARSGF